MDRIIEMSIETTDGIVDCRLEPERINDELCYDATILYPNFINGYSRSGIYCYTVKCSPETGNYYLEEGEEGIHPKIKKLEAQISDYMKKSVGQ